MSDVAALKQNVEIHIMGSLDNVHRLKIIALLHPVIITGRFGTDLQRPHFRIISKQNKSFFHLGGEFLIRSGISCSEWK